MLTIILFVTIALLHANWRVRKFMRQVLGARYFDFPDLQLFFTLHVLGAAFLAMFFAVFVLNPILPRVRHLESSKTIVAMRGANETHGTVVWGNGTIAGRHVFTVYVDVGSGGVTPVRIDSGRVVIVEDASLHNTGVWNRTVSVNDRNSLLAPWSLFKEDRLILTDELRVPVGSVQHEFRAN